MVSTSHHSTSDLVLPARVMRLLNSCSCRTPAGCFMSSGQQPAADPYMTPQAASPPHRGTTASGTSHLDCPAGLILTCSLLGVSGVTCAVSCVKLGPYSGWWSVTSVSSVSNCSGPAV